MAYDSFHQFSELIKQHQAILITTNEAWTGDALASAFALRTLLSAYGKKVTISVADFEPKPTYEFLPLTDIVPKLQKLQQTIISVNTERVAVREYYHRKTDNELRFYLVPESGQLTAQDIDITTSGYAYDLIITLGVPDFESLGNSYHQQTDLWHLTPVINIDHVPANEQYGSLNIVDVTADSIAEIIYNLIEHLDPALITPDIATQLLTGIITATDNFRQQSLRPQTLELASRLVNLGAQREMIVTNLYHNRRAETLRLWGRALGRLEIIADGALAVMTLTQADFIETQSDPTSLDELISDLIVTMPNVVAAAILYEQDAQTTAGIIITLDSTDARDLGRDLEASGSAERAEFEIAESLTTARPSIIAHIERRLHSPLA